MGKIISFEELSSIRKSHAKKRVVHCHGVFDLFHYGHLLHLNSAKKFGDLLVVTVTPDRFVNKGPGRPRFSEQQRAFLLASLELVDYVAINKFPKAVEPIKALKPHFYVKGPDYRDRQKDITGGILEEQDAVESAGGKLVFTNDEVSSSTEILNQYFSHWTDAQQEAISAVKKVIRLDGVLELIDSFRRMRVLVVGEPIIDSYIFCQPEALSSKSPTVSARFLNREDYAGGSLAIANHLSALGCGVTLLMTHGVEKEFQDLLGRSVAPGVDVVGFPLADVPTPRKSRFLSTFQVQRIFELIHLRSDQWAHHNPAKFCAKLRTLAKSHDMVIAADFGHGLFEGPVLQELKKIPAFLALNVQTNSGNYGYNLFTKHARFDYMSIDERECRLAMHDRFTPIKRLAEKTVREKIRKRTSITLGTAGSLYYNGKGEKVFSPTMLSEPVDTTGAGDAYFTVTSLLVKQTAPSPLIPFLGNCYAGLKTKILGNKSAVSKIDFIRTIQSILK